LEKKFEKDKRYHSDLVALATPNRVLLKDGPLSKKFGKLSRQISAWKEYYFFLFNDIIVYTEKNVLGTYKLKHVVPLRDMKITRGSLPTGEDTLIDIEAKNGKSFPVNATNQENRDEWFSAINKAIDQQSAQFDAIGKSTGDAAGMVLSGIGKQVGSKNKLASMMGMSSREVNNKVDG